MRNRVEKNACACSENRKSVCFFTHDGPYRPFGSAVCRRLTENASRHYEESPESGPTDNRPEGTNNPCPTVAGLVASATAWSLRDVYAVSRSPGIDSVPVVPRVYGTTSAGITSEEVGPLCSDSIARRCIYMHSWFRKLSAPNRGLPDSSGMRG